MKHDTVISKKELDNHRSTSYWVSVLLIITAYVLALINAKQNSIVLLGLLNIITTLSIIMYTHNRNIVIRHLILNSRKIKKVKIKLDGENK